MKEAATVTLWIASTESVRQRIGGDALDPAERRRSAGISHPGEYERFVASRALLRHAMTEAAEAAISPDQWRFVADSRGKPMVAECLPSIPFSLSHAGNCVAVAVGGSSPLGVDVEGMWRDAGSEIILTVLTDGERRGLSEHREDAQWEHFIRIWTVKEACAKALGDGVAIDFSTIEVDLDLRSASLRSGAGAPGPVFRLFAREVSVTDRCYHLAAAAIAGAAPGLEFRLVELES